MSTALGKVRLVEPGTPGLPPREPDMDLWCDERIEVTDLPPMLHDSHTVAYLCTRLPHGDDEPHVSDPGDPPVTGTRVLDPRIIVWGGE